MTWKLMAAQILFSDVDAAENVVYDSKTVIDELINACAIAEKQLVESLVDRSQGDIRACTVLRVALAKASFYKNEDCFL